MADKQQLLASAETALYNLQSAREKLSAARGLGTLDILGGGLLTSAAKHNRLREVAACLEAAQVDCQYLQTNLQEQLDLQSIDIGNGLKTMDVWFDNIFSDLMVQDKIIAAQTHIDEKIYQLQNIIARLKF